MLPAMVIVVAQPHACLVDSCCWRCCCPRHSYQQALETVLKGQKLLQKAKIQYERPGDYYAEMVKTDGMCPLPSPSAVSSQFSDLPPCRPLPYMLRGWSLASCLHLYGGSPVDQLALAPYTRGNGRSHATREGEDAWRPIGHRGIGKGEETTRPAQGRKGNPTGRPSQAPA